MIARAFASISIEPCVWSAMSPPVSRPSWLAILPAMDDARRILTLRGIRAFAFGFTSVLLGVHLADVLSPARAGAVVTATLGGAAALSAVLGARGDRIGRRRAHVSLSIAMAGAMSAFALTSSFPVLLVVALTGTIATTFLE